MTWREFVAARQLLAEEHLGVYARQPPALEDAQFTKAKDLAPRG